MRQRHCFASLPLLFFLLTASASAYVRLGDLVLWYTFDEIRESLPPQVPDQSDNGLDGTISVPDGESPVTVDSRFGKSLKFNGTSNKVTLKYDDKLKLPQYTVSIWMNSVKSNDYWVGVFGRAGRHNCFWQGQGNQDKWYVHHRYRDGNDANAGVPNAGNFAHGEWYNVVLTNDGAVSATYVNGKLEQTGVMKNALINQKSNLYVGATPDGGNGGWYEGLMDDVRLYSVSLDSDEVARLFNNGKGDFNFEPVLTLNGESHIRLTKDGTYIEAGASAMDAEDGPLTEITTTYFSPSNSQGREPVARWKFDGDATDATGNGNDGKRIADATFADAKYGQGLKLDGTGDRVEVPAFKGVKDSAAVSISAWVNINTLGNGAIGDGGIVTTRGNTAPTFLWVNYDAAGVDKPSISMNVGDTGIESNRVNGPADILKEGQWHHVVGVMEGVSRKLYIDGELKATEVDAAAQTSLMDGVDVWIGGWDITANFDFDGTIDEVRVYDVALTDEEITALLIWDGLDATGPTTLDSSVSGDWTVSYSVTDSFGNIVTAERQVRVFDPSAPVITLTGEANLNHELTTEFNDPGATVADAAGNALAAAEIKVTGIVDGDAPGTYTLAYDFTDAEGRAAETVFRTVNVADNTPPIITLKGGDSIKHQVGQPFVDPGFTAEDNIDGAIAATSDQFEWNALIHRGFHGNWDESVVDFNGNGGLLKDTPLGEGRLTSALNFNGDADFRNAGVGIEQNDNYRNLFLGVFHAKVEGEYEFGVQWPDDRASFWLDVDQDGVFETEGGRGTEWMNLGSRFGYSTVKLQPGIYNVALGHMEGGGGSRIQARVRTPKGAGPEFLVDVNPGSDMQKGLWGIDKSFDVNVPGIHEIIYTATDAAGNTATVKRSVTVEEIQNRPVLTLKGRPSLKHPLGTEFVDEGATVASADGTELDASKIVVTGEVDHLAIGECILTYNYTDILGRPADAVKRTIHVGDLEPPVITLADGDTVEHVAGQPFKDPGVTVEDNIDQDLVWGSTISLPDAGLVLHIDATAIPGAKDGDVLGEWVDFSGTDNHMTDVRGDPSYVSDGINRLPAVHLDGDDYMAVTRDVQRRYSIFTVSRLDGTRNARLLSSRNMNWLIGYWNALEDTYHPEGWAAPIMKSATTDPHLYSAVSTGSTNVQFFADGVDRTNNPKRNGRIGKFQIGGYRANSERSAGYVSEVLIYDVDVTPAQRLSVEAYLASKYRLLDHPEYGQPKLDVPGEYTILYVAVDSAGNRGFATRKLIVKPDPTIPVIVLQGGSEVQHQAGVEFTDPGAKVVDGEGKEIDGAVPIPQGTVDHSKPGIYMITYGYTGADEKTALRVVRTVVVADTAGPVITLEGEAVIQIAVGADFTDKGASATDAFEGDVPVYLKHDIPVMEWVPGLLAGGLTGNINTTSPNPGNLGFDPLGPSYSENKSKPPWADNYTIVYSGQVFDEDGKVSFMGDIDDKFWLKINDQVVVQGGGWANSQSVQLDLADGDFGWYDFELRMSNGGGGAGRARQQGFGIDKSGQTPGKKNVNNKLFEIAKNTDEHTMDLFRVQGPDYNQFDTSKAGSYIITYTAKDSLGQTGTAQRTLVIREDLGKPFITLNGAYEITLEVDTTATFKDPGAKAVDATGKVLKDDIVAEGAVDLAKPGVYTLTYDYEDAQGNFTDPAVRKVTVVDSHGPSITLKGDPYMTVFIGKEFVDPGANATDTFDGDVEVHNNLGFIPGHLNHWVYTLTPFNENYVILDSAESVLNGEPAGRDYLGDGPKGEGLLFTNDQDFRQHPGLKQDNNYQNIFIGYFNASRDGDYYFETLNRDDRITCWIDRDGDDVFSRQGLMGDERITWGAQSNTIYLFKGAYKVAFGHMEGGGGSSIYARFNTPGGEIRNVHPAAQPEYWSTLPGTPIDTSVEGSHNITYFAVDQAGNWTSETRVVVVKEDPEKPLIVLLGDSEVQVETGTAYKDAGALLEDYKGTPLENPIVIEGVPDGMTSGVYTITYNFTDAEGHTALEVARNVIVADTKPPVITVSGANPATVQMGQAYTDAGATAVDARDGAVQVHNSLGFPEEGLVLHLDAGFFKGQLNDGDAITSDWEDQSGEGNNADNRIGDPTWIENGPNGRPVVNFDGNDMIWTSKNFEPDLANYSILTVARYTGGDNERVISSRNNRNWLFGFHGNSIRRFYAQGWVHYGGFGSDTIWHVHAGDANNKDQINFWLDEVQLASNANGQSNNLYKPKNIQLGGYNGNNEMSKCEVAEVLLYDRVITDTERTLLVKHLNSKYGINGGGDFLLAGVDTSSEGEQIVSYVAMDSTGNASTATRKVLVVDQPSLPVITLVGDAEVSHDSGKPYTDAGATVADSDGNALDASKLVVSSNVNVDVPGSYPVAFDYSDDAGTASTVVRIVNVVDSSPPVITLVGGETFEHQLGNKWVEPGVTALDNADGEVQVTNSILQENFLIRYGFMIDKANDSVLNLDQNGGLLKETPVGEVRVTKGPRNLGLYYNGDANFKDGDPMRPFDVGINRNDQYQNLFLGHFYCPIDGGIYSFGVEWPDDRAAIWLDLDQDGVFESNGDHGTELMNGTTYTLGYKEVELRKGYYRFAAAHREGGGGSRIDVRFRSIIGPGPSATNVRPNPGDPAQAGFWVQYNPIDVSTPGEYEITYTASDSAGNVAEVKRNVIVKTNPNAPIIVLKGEGKMTLNYGDEFQDPGAYVEDLDGNELDASKLVITGKVDPQRMGLYTLEYSYISEAGIPARTETREVTVVDAEPPAITLAGEATMTIHQGQAFEDPGATAVDNYDGELAPASSQLFPTDGLLMHLDASNILGVAPGGDVDTWTDSSGEGNDATKSGGGPYLEEDAINGRPAVYFDGASRITAPMTVGNKYTVVSVSRADGIRKGRLMSSSDQNWFLGYQNIFEDVFYSGGWSSNRDAPVSDKIHLYSATSTGSNRVQFYSNGSNLTTTTTRNGQIGHFQLGAYRTGNEPGSGHVAEVVIYNRVLPDLERMAVEARMSARYSLNGISGMNVPVDTSALGTYHVVYSVSDGAGNVGIATRTVEVVPDPNAPVITLIGDAEIKHEAGNDFTDPGVTLTAGENKLDASLVKVGGQVDSSHSGAYILTYSYRPYKKVPAADVVRTVVVSDTKAPVITLDGETTMRLKLGTEFTDPGFSATDLADGDVAAHSHLESTPNALDVSGYMVTGRNNNQMNFDQGGGILAVKPVGANQFSGDITSLIGDAAFQKIIPQITKRDDYQLVFRGLFKAKVDGTYEFGIDNADDRCSFWIDLDQDDIFEANGDNGPEVIFTNYTGGGYKKHNLTEGFYNVAIGFMEFSGNAWVRPRISLPGGSRIAIHPANANQSGHWFASPSSVVDVNTAGTYTIEYSAFDSSGNSTTATRTVVVVEDSSVPFIALKGEAGLQHDVGTPFTDPGAKVTDATGGVLEADLKGVGDVDVKTLGEYILAYDYNGAEQVTRKVVVADLSAPKITLSPHANGGVEVVKLTVGQAWEDPGVTLQDVGDANAVYTTDRLYIPNQLLHKGFTVTPNVDALLAFEDNGGLMKETPVGEGFLKDGPGDRGLYFQNDNDFKGARIGIKQNDQYQSYVEGYFLARIDGKYEFRTRNTDDRSAFYVDLDQDGIFKRKGGTKGDERLSWGNNGRTVTLTAGFYKVAIGHIEYGGGSRIEAVFKAPAGAGPTALATIKPTDPAQGGIWYSAGYGPIDITRPGEHTITYYASDASGNLSTTTRKVIIEIDLTAPVLTLLGEQQVTHEAGADFTDQGATVADMAGNELDKSAIKVTASLDGTAVDGGVDGKVPGTYEILYEYTDANGKTAVPVRRNVVVRDTVAPAVTLLGKNPARITPGGIYVDAGATALDAFDGDVTVTFSSSKPTFKFVPGLLAGSLAGNNTPASRSGPNNGSLGIDPLGPTISEIKTSPPWGPNTTIIYTGQIYDKDGKMAFTENVDDGTRLTVAGKVLIDDGSWNTRVDANFDSADGQGGWFDFEVRFRNGGGGAGVAVAPGFAFDSEGAKEWVLPRNSDSETADLFRYKEPQHNTIDTSREGEYTITFTAIDAAGNITELVRTIIVKDDPTLPVITLAGEAEMTHEAGTAFPDPGATVADRKGNPLDATKISISGGVDHMKLGTYTLAYDFTNDKGRSAPTLQRKVTVVDTTAPAIELIGGTPLKLSIGDPFQDPGANVTDNLDQGLVADVMLEGSLEGLVAHWTFDDGQGATAQDLVGELDGTLTNFANIGELEDPWVDGKFGKALQFNGINEYVLVPDTDKLNLQKLTLSAWVNAANFAQDGFIFEKTTGGLVNSHFSLYLQDNDQMNFRLVSGGNLNDTFISSTDSFKANEWNHVAVTYDGTIKSIYVDGELVTAMPAVVTFAPSSNGLSTIGAMGSGTDFFFNGKIDDVRIYDRAVAEADIHKLSASAGIDTSQATVRPYIMTYTSTDSSGNTATVKREIIVSNDGEAPVITLLGDLAVTVNIDNDYEDAGATALDNIDGNLTPFIDDGGSVDAVDTSVAGEYIITYDVADFSGNKAVQVTRKVTVVSNDPVDAWIISTGLAALTAAEKALDADPDLDGVPNLLEYALAGDPVKSDRSMVLPIFDDSSGTISITFYRLKPTADSTLTYKAALSTNLANAAAWDESAVIYKGALQGIPQTELPDGKAFAVSSFERVKVSAKNSIAAEPAGKHFLRLVVEKK